MVTIGNTNCAVIAVAAFVGRVAFWRTGEFIRNLEYDVAGTPCERVLPALICCKRRGIVIDNLDPISAGRLRIDVPDLFEGGPQWAMPAVPFRCDRPAVRTAAPAGSR